MKSQQELLSSTNFCVIVPTYNNQKMKSGTIADVLGYAGYANNGGKTPLTFALLVNNYSGSASSMRQKMYVLLNSLK